MEERRPAEFLQGHKGPYKRLLRCLFDLRQVSEPAGQIREERFLVTVHQQSEVLRMPVTAAFHAFAVAQVHTISCSGEFIPS